MGELNEQSRVNIKSFVVSIISTVALLVLIFAASIYKFNNELTRVLLERNHSTIMQTAQLQKVAFASHLSDCFAMLNRTANFISSLEEPTPAEIERVLDSSIKSTSFVEMGFAGREGLEYTDKGEVRPISQPHFYARAIGGERLIGEPMFSQEGGPYHYIVVPVYSQQGVVGALYGAYPAERLAAALKANEGPDSCGAIVVSTSGEVILSVDCSAELHAGTDVLRHFGNLTLEDITLSKLALDLSSGKKGSFQIKSGADSKYAVYQPLGVSNWRLITLLPQGVINHEATEISQGFIVLITRVSMVFAALVVLQLLWMFRSSLLLEKAMLGAQRANREYKALIENIRGGVLTLACTSDMELLFASAGFERLTGYSHAEIEQLFGGKYLKIVHLEDRSRLQLIYKSTCREQAIGSCEHRVLCKDKGVKWVLMNWSVVENPDLRKSAHCVLTDITESRVERERLRIAQERYQVVLAQTESLILDYNFLDNSYVTNSPDGKLFGYELKEELLHNELISRNIIYHEDADLLRELFVRLFSGEKQVEITVRFDVVGAGLRWHRLTFTGISNNRGVVVRAIGRINDIDRQKRESDLLREKATRDSLTGAYNKTTTALLIDELLQKPDCGCVSALLVMDLDNFKLVNDCYGHLMGDAILEHFAKLVSAHIGIKDIFGRVGGDEFVLLLAGHQSVEEAIAKAEGFWASINHFSLPSAPEAKISLSIGAFAAPNHGQSYQTFFEKADKMLLGVKACGKGRICFYDETQQLMLV